MQEIQKSILKLLAGQARHGLLASSVWHLVCIVQVGAAAASSELFLLMCANLFPLARETVYAKEGQCSKFINVVHHMNGPPENNCVISLIGCTLMKTPRDEE